MDDTTHPFRLRPPDEQLVERFLARETSPEETRCLRTWAGTTRLGEPIADVVREAIGGTWVGLRDPRATRDALWEQLRIDPPGSAGHVPQRGPLDRVWIPSLLRGTGRVAMYAAMCIVVIVAGVVSWRSTEPRLSRQESRSYATGVGQFAQIQVANGSRFILAPSSRLTLVEDGNHVRSAVLIGEARFDIVPDSRSPFEVRTGRVVTRVLGTTFDVRRYADDTIGHVSVFSGKVTTSAIGHGTPLTLTAGMSARFTDSVIVAKGSINRNSYIDWEHGHLVFRDAPVPVVLDVLSKWYAYQFQVMDSAIARRHITATFAFGESADMLRLLKRVLRANMTVQDSVVMLRPGRHGVESTPAPERYKEHNPFIHSREFGR